MPFIKLLLAHKIATIASVGVLAATGTGTIVLLKNLQPRIADNTDSSQQTSNESATDTDTGDTTKKEDGKKSGSTADKSKTATKPKTSTSPSSGSTSGGSSSTGGTSPSTSGGSTTPTPPSTGGGSSGGFKANCISVPSACGYPDASNTGPSGTLTNSGSITVTQNGAVIQNLNITGRITVNADNVTIRNVRITSGDYYPISYNRSGLVVEDTEIIGTSTGVTSGIAFANYTARRVEVRGTADGFKADANVVIQDSYIHGLRETASSHNDGIQATGGSNVIVRHNTFALSGTNAEVMQFNGTNSNWIIENNLLDGGGWVFNASSLNGTPIRNNRFTRTQGYGIAQISGATYTGNYYDDNGAAIILK